MASTMMLVIGVFISVIVLSAIGGGIGYLIFLRTKPNKETYKAYIYR